MSGPSHTTSRSRPVHGTWERILSIDSFGAVLISILITYAAAILITGDEARTVVVFLQISTVWLVFRVAHARPAIRTATNVLLGLAGVVAILNLLSLTGSNPEGVLFAASCLLYLVAPVTIVHYVIKRRVIDAETLLGAVAAYLLIGMFFAFAYVFLGSVQSGQFFGAQGDGTLADCLFFSFTTMTTIGFGSLVPAGNPGQSFAVAEGVIGQLFLVVAVAKIVGSWTPKRVESDPAEI